LGPFCERSVRRYRTRFKGSALRFARSGLAVSASAFLAARAPHHARPFAWPPCWPSRKAKYILVIARAAIMKAGNPRSLPPASENLGVGKKTRRRSSIIAFLNRSENRVVRLPNEGNPPALPHAAERAPSARGAVLYQPVFAPREEYAEVVAVGVHGRTPRSGK